MRKWIEASIYKGTIGFWSSMTLWGKVKANSFEELVKKVAQEAKVSEEAAGLAVAYNDIPVRLGWLKPLSRDIVPPDDLPGNLKVVGTNMLSDEIYEDESGYWWPFYLEVAWFEEKIEEGR
jgi:hypothetical protein